MSSAPREENRVPGLVAKADDDVAGVNTPVVLEADPITKRLKVTTTVSGVAAIGGLLSGLVYDDVVFTNEDANGNPQTATVKLDGATIRVIKMTYNSDSKLTRIYKDS